jgi:hypothetical protein
MQTRSGAHVFDAIAVFMMSVKPVSYVAQSLRWLDQAREVLGCKYYSLRTERAYSDWIKFYAPEQRRNGKV